MKSQKAKAQEFQDLHRSKRLFILPNAWDVPSGRLFEDLGFPAVATSSAGMMVSLGYPDGQTIPKKEFFSAIAKIARMLSVPVSADIVAGFGSTPKQVVGAVRSVIKAGAIGVNLEDFEHSTKRLFSLESQAMKLQAVKKLVRSMGIPFVVNGRTDAFRFAEGNDEAKLKEAIRRAKAYRNAGCDCVYPMGLVEHDMIKRFVEALDCPVNVMVRKGLPTLGELDSIGVKRVSFGPAASYAIFGFLKRACQEVLEKGTFSSLTDGAISFDELNSLALPRKNVP
jgi:2-methylisocitrate lyase-like PEP mutase family enzyme